MAHKHNIKSLDAMLRDVYETEQLFRGKVIVIGGYFRQVLPVVPRETQFEAVEASLVSSPI